MIHMCILQECPFCGQDTPSCQCKGNPCYDKDITEYVRTIKDDENTRHALEAANLRRTYGEEPEEEGKVAYVG